MRRQSITGLIILLIFLLGQIAGCGSESTTGESAERGSDGEQNLVKIGKGSRVPDFTLERVEGGTLEFASLRGKTVLVDFWDTWCGPCKYAMPHLQALSETYAEDLVVVGIAFGREGRGKVQAFIRDRGLSFEMLMADPDYKIVENFGGISSLPTTFLIDGDGVIIEKWIGAESLATYDKGIRMALGI